MWKVLMKTQNRIVVYSVLSSVHNCKGLCHFLLTSSQLCCRLAFLGEFWSVKFIETWDFFPDISKNTDLRETNRKYNWNTKSDLDCIQFFLFSIFFNFNKWTVQHIALCSNLLYSWQLMENVQLFISNTTLNLPPLVSIHIIQICWWIQNTHNVFEWWNDSG